MNSATRAQAIRNNTLDAIEAIESLLGHEYRGPLFAEVRSSYLRGVDLAVTLRLLYKVDGANVEAHAGALLTLAFGKAARAFEADFATVYGKAA
jgi:hypothetical protein